MLTCPRCPCPRKRLLFLATLLCLHGFLWTLKMFFFYLLWTRRQFHVYLMRVHTWGCKHTGMRHFFAPVHSSWVELLPPDEMSELRRRCVAGPRAYADTWSTYATTAPDFPPLPPFNLDQENSSHSIGGCSLSCPSLRKSSLFTDSTISIALFEENFLRFFHSFFVNFYLHLFLTSSRPIGF